MSSPSPSPRKLDKTPARSPRLSRLPLTSFLLSLVPLLLFGLYILNVLLVGRGFNVGVGPVSTEVGPIVFLWASAVLFYVGGLLSSIGGIATGIWAMSRARRSPHQPTRTGLATAGVVLGSVYLCLAACVAAYAVLLYNALHSVVGPNGR